MQKINLTDLQSQINSRQLKESKPSEQPQVDEDSVWNLWETMTKLFHHAWTGREGEEPTDHWGKLLTELSQEQINNGFDQLLKWTSSFPPTVLQFRNLCLGITTDKNGHDTTHIHKGSAHISFNDKRHPEHEVYGKHKRLEDKTTAGKRKKAGNDALSALKGSL